MMISLALMVFLSLLLWFEWDNFEARIVDHELKQMIDSEAVGYCLRCGRPHGTGDCGRCF